MAAMIEEISRISLLSLLPLVALSLISLEVALHFVIAVCGYSHVLWTDTD